MVDSRFTRARFGAAVSGAGKTFARGTGVNAKVKVKSKPLQRRGVLAHDYRRGINPLSTAQLARVHEAQLRSDAGRVYGSAGSVDVAARDHERFVRQQRY